MRYLLDSQCLLMAAFEPARLPHSVGAILANLAHDCFVSAISPYELEVKKATGKLGFPDVADWAALLVRNPFIILPVTVPRGVLAARLPTHHRDPWDRLLVAQAATEGLVLLTGDRATPAYGVPVVW